MTKDKQRNLARTAQRFLLDRRIPQATYRFDVLVLESQSGHLHGARLRKNAFSV